MALKMRKNHSPAPPEPCMLTECMQVIAGAWAPNVIWCLRAGPRRFSELRADIPPVTSKVLSTRLRELEERGVILRNQSAAGLDHCLRVTVGSDDAMTRAFTALEEYKG